MHPTLLSCLLSFDVLAGCPEAALVREDFGADPGSAPALSAPQMDAGERGAPSSEPYEPGTYRLQFDLPLFDSRNSRRLFLDPSMQQSLRATKSAYYLAHWPALELGRVLGGAGWLFVGAMDIALSKLPLGSVWLHEEWHRAVMNRREIDSYNGVYDFDLGASVTPVREVSDADLIALKRDHPAEMVRLSSAGFEAQYTLGLQFDKDRFFHGTAALMQIQQWYDLVTSISYLLSAAYDSESITREILQDEGTDVGQRDFTGLDPVAWVYDLFRPNEQYETRGEHPSGVGINRYRTEEHLTAAERGYLRRQSWLSLLNLANPNLFGIDAFEVDTGAPGGLRFNASLQHYLAPFGSSTNLNGFVQVQGFAGFVQLHAHVNDERVWPGITAELVRTPLWGTSLQPSVRVWLQPEDQSFFAKAAELGAAAGLHAALSLGAVELYSELEFKTDGWIAGSDYLDANWSSMVGLQASVF